MPQSPNRLGPVVLPWDENSPSEVLVFLAAGLVGAIVGATMLHYYRRAR